MRANIQSVQYLRGVAAMMVVFHHGHPDATWFADPMRGSYAANTGVDIFFVISGFIMYLTARSEEPVRFLRRRFVRIAPLYWAVTLALLAFNLAKGAVTPETWGAVAKSLVFIPQHSLADPTRIEPYLVPGWTLEYEMFFYVLFAIALAFGRPLYSAIVIVVLTVAGAAMHPQSPILMVYTSTLMLEFVGGMLVAVAFTRSHLKPMPFLLVGGFVALLCSDLWDLPRWIEKGGPALAIVVGALSLESHVREWKLPKLLGDASYSIYLSHPLTLVVVFGAAKRLPLHGPLQFLAVVSVAMISSALVGVLTFRHVETPLLGLFRQRGMARKVA